MCERFSEEEKMTVAAILADKGKEVISAKPSVTLQEISKTLADNRIGAIVIIDAGGKVCGIASERDVVRQIAGSGPAALDAPVSSCMTSKVISCSLHHSIDEVMGVMTNNRFRHLPVIEDGKLQGIVSIGDVVKKKIEKAEREAEDLKLYIAG